MKQVDAEYRPSCEKACERQRQQPGSKPKRVPPIKNRQPDGCRERQGKEVVLHESARYEKAGNRNHICTGTPAAKDAKTESPQLQNMSQKLRVVYAHVIGCQEEHGREKQSCISAGRPTCVHPAQSNRDEDAKACEGGQRQQPAGDNIVTQP